MNNAFIIHGFNGDTTYTFGPSLKKFLEQKKYNVIMPKFPIRQEASFDKWSKILDNYKQFFDENTIVVAHSIGNPFFIRYLNNNNLKTKLYVSVAGFCDLFKVPDRDDLNNAFVDFAVSSKDIEYFKKNVKYRYSLYSDNDHVIPFNILESFVDKIQSNPVFIEGVGHMGNRNNISRLPQIEKIIESLIWDSIMLFLLFFEV